MISAIQARRPAGRHLPAERRQLIGEAGLPNAALSAEYGHIVDATGKAILDADGKQIPVAKTPAQKAAGAKKGGLALAAKMAKDARGKIYNSGRPRTPVRTSPTSTPSTRSRRRSRPRATRGRGGGRDRSAGGQQGLCARRRWQAVKKKK
jgi:hypothetical protein